MLVLLLGSVPSFTGHGYFGNKIVAELLNPGKITYYREVVYNTDPSTNGAGSSVVVKTGLENPFTFAANTGLAFVYVVLGPFPWQIRYLRQLFVVPEMIAWYAALFFMIKGMARNVKNQYKVMLPIIVFSIILCMVIAIYSSNFGIITRVRMSAFLALLCLLPFGAGWLKNIKIPLLNNIV